MELDIYIKFCEYKIKIRELLIEHHIDKKPLKIFKNRYSQWLLEYDKLQNEIIEAYSELDKII